MSRITTPKFYKSKIKDYQNEGPLKQSITQFAEFIGDPTRGLVFFPEYTEHGIQHFQHVIDATERLMNKQCRKRITPEDVTVMVLSVLLHDLAMHLTEDGFLTLIQSDDFKNVVPEIDNEPWRDLWESYCSDVSRWGARKINSLLGPIEHRDFQHCLDILLNPIDEMRSTDEWTPACFKITGEFIRRNHGRMAHEFAVVGIPGVPGIKVLQPLEGFDGDIRDLCGLIGRSHTIELRKSFAYLQEKHHGLVTCNNCHPVFLMSLLRIADYLHIEANRAPAVSLSVRSIRSPFSRGEWDSHQSISEVRQDEKDKEAIFVVANPSNVGTFLKVQHLLKDLQNEIDNTWAVLGEVYSRSDFDTAGIRLRRVRSNIEDLNNFQKGVNYLPAKFAFETAGVALLDKLVGGLYGDKPEVGVRELLQNAIDAVNEYKCYIEKIPSSEIGVQKDDPDIRVILEGTENEGGILTIEDYGIGMDENVLSNYFLCVGASFRDSDIWKKDFTDHGVVKVTRSGRFGVGVLAAFLLGKKMEVTTRHFRAVADQALHFSASIEDEVIEIKKTHRHYPGTTISIQISPKTYIELIKLDGLEWDWYRWINPKIERIINGRNDLRKLTQIPATGDQLPEEWHRINVDGYDEVIWTFGRAPNLVCNGLTIGSSASSYGYHHHMHWEGLLGPLNMDILLAVPYVSVCDNNGNLPIDLQRFSLHGDKYPFAEQLLADVTKDYCAFCFVFGPDSPRYIEYLSEQSIKHYPRFIKWQISFAPVTHWLFTKDGAAPLHWANLKQLTLRKIKVLLTLNSSCPFPTMYPSDGEAILYGRLEPNHRIDISLPEALLHLFGKCSKQAGPNPHFFNENTGAMILSTQEVMNYAAAKIDLTQLLSIGVEMTNQVVNLKNGTNTTLSLWSNCDYNYDSTNISPEIIDAVACGNFIYAEVLCPRMTLKLKENSFYKTWWDIMSEPIIPYDENRRTELLSKVLPELQIYVDKWKSLKAMEYKESSRRFHRESSERL